MTWTAEDLRRWMVENDLTRHADAAEALGVSRSWITQFLNGKEIPRVVVLAAMGWSAMAAKKAA